MKEEELSTLGHAPEAENDLKDYIINYTGKKLDPEDEKVTIEMIIDVLSQDFPELVLCLSEENWIRGYKQGLTDVEEGQKILEGSQSEKLHQE